jgi:hypothetical protein
MINTKFDQAESILSMAILKSPTALASGELDKLVNVTFREVLKTDIGGNLTDDDLPVLIDLLETKYNTTMGIGEVLVNTEVPHDEDWYSKREIDYNYWPDYQKLLINENWPTNVIGSMNTVTDKILGLLPDPAQDREHWYRRGLVLGHVQSGKTANYIGVISKAADAGYKFIIVIAGVHNNLRKQTQQRIDEGFVGRNSVTKAPIGVGKISPNRVKPFTVTTLDSDFDITVENKINLELKDLNNTFVLVIKKNVSTLRRLYSWLKKLNTKQGYERISNIPMLMIDDEADNASINTNKPELDPTSTNRELRNILQLFNKRAYVGYTATPFANIFINPDEEHVKHGNDLFPEDFIYCLDAPTNYFGSEKIFLEEESSKQSVRTIKDAFLHLPQKQKKGVEVTSLPNSMIDAMYLFLLARTIRNLRGQKNKHCSMLINVHIVMDVQRQIKSLLDEELRDLKRAVKFNCKKIESEAIKDPLVQRLKKLFAQEYSLCEFNWFEILPALVESSEMIKSFMVNSESDDRLDYAEADKNEEAITAIAIGGLSLSRGLTVEGLTISYIYRNSKMYDTLLQMGRWFGYRAGYEDLCRVYMTEDSFGWYKHISEASEELRSRLKRMRRDGKTPIDFGLLVRAHPDTLIVTALNKMRNAELKELEISYSGTLVETFILPDSTEKNDINATLIEVMFKGLNKDNFKVVDNTDSYCFKDVSYETIQDFLFKFQYHALMGTEKEVLPEFVKQIAAESPRWDVIFKNPRGQKSPSHCIASQERRVGFHKDSEFIKMPDSETGYYVGGKQRFSGNSMFAIGLDVIEVNSAKELAKDNGRKSPLYCDYTDVRNKPVLMIHYLNLVKNIKSDKTNLILGNVPAISLSFPGSSSNKTVSYVVNPVWLKQFNQDREEWPEDELDNE